MSAVLQDTSAVDVEVIDRAEIRDGKAVVQYSRTELAIAELRAKYKDATYDLTTVAGDKAARSARLDLVTLRAGLEKRRKELKAPALQFGKLIDSEAERLASAILALEAPIDQQIKDGEARREKVRKEKADAEAARVQKHRDAIAQVRGYVDAARAAGMTAERVLKGISALEAMKFDPAQWEEFATEAVQAKAQTITALLQIHADLKTAEETAARLEFQRQEQARIAAAQAEAQRRLDEQAAELRRQQEALQAQQRAAAAEAERIEAERQHAARIAAENAATDIPAQDPQQVLKAEPATADATNRETPAVTSPVGGPVGAGQAAAAAPVVVRAAEPATLNVSAINARLAPFGIAAAGMAALGIEPASRDGAARMFTESQFARLVEAGQEHFAKLLQPVEA